MWLQTLRKDSYVKILVASLCSIYLFIVQIRQKMHPEQNLHNMHRPLTGHCIMNYFKCEKKFKARLGFESNLEAKIFRKFFGPVNFCTS